jgi:protein-tyrosine-phosphatase
MENTKIILVVCGGNTCRSSMAKVILGQMLKAKGLEKQFDLDSAAYNSAYGPTAHPNSQQVIKELYGLDLLASQVPK